MKRSPRIVIQAVLVALVPLAALLTPGTARATLTDSFTGHVDASGTSWASHKFNVVDIGTINATLDWSASANLNMFLYDPTGTQVAQATSTTNKPETITYEASVTGTWKIGVKAKSGSTDYSLTVTHSPNATPPPPAMLSYASTFGYSGTAGLYPYGIDWDASDNTILVGDVWNYRVQRFTANGSIPAGCPDPCVVSHQAGRGLLGGIGSPFDVEADPDGNIWVADQSYSRVVEFDHNGNWLQTIGPGGGPYPGEDYPAGCGGGKMRWPTHIMVDPTSHNVYVSDTQCGAVYVFSPTGTFLFQFKFDLNTCCGIKVPIPRGIAQDNDGSVFVVEHRTRRVVVFDDLGNQIGLFPQRTDMQDPRGLDVDPVNHYVYVVDAYDSELFRYDSTTGLVIDKWTMSGTTRLDNIRFVTVDGDGNVYVGDTWSYRVWKFDPAGNPLTWGYAPKPPPDGGYNQNNGIAFDPSTGGHLYAIDSFENRIQGFAVQNPTGGTWWCRSKSNCPAFERSFGHRGSAIAGTCNMGYGRGISFGDGLLYADGGQRVIVFDTAGNCVRDWGAFGSTPGTFKGNTSVRVVSDNDPSTNDVRVYTVDYNCRVQIFDSVGNLLNAMGGTCGTSDPSQMSTPRQPEVIGGRVYVADQGRNRIAVWDTATGSVVQSITGPFGGTDLRLPEGVVYDSANDWLYITDTGNKRIVRCRPDGSSPQVVTVDWKSSGGFFTQPRYLEMGSGATLFVNDSRRVYAFQVTG
jgi:DNA-binding beta-propeller fold protein YncE